MINATLDVTRQVLWECTQLDVTKTPICIELTCVKFVGKAFMRKYRHWYRKWDFLTFFSLFFRAYILKEHILTHSDIKRYTCDICGRQLRNDSCYRRHMMNIHGQKITCDHCNKDFSSPMGVKIHKRDAHGIMYWNSIAIHISCHYIN